MVSQALGTDCLLSKREGDERGKERTTEGPNILSLEEDRSARMKRSGRKERRQRKTMCCHGASRGKQQLIVFKLLTIKSSSIISEISLSILATLAFSKSSCRGLSNEKKV